VAERNSVHEDRKGTGKRGKFRIDWSLFIYRRADRGKPEGGANKKIEKWLRKRLNRAQVVAELDEKKCEGTKKEISMGGSGGAVREKSCAPRKKGPGG